MEHLLDKLEDATDAVREVGVALEADQGQLPARAAYQLGQARMAVAIAMDCLQAALRAVGGMIPEDFTFTQLSR